MTYVPSMQPPIKWLLIRPTQGALITLGAISLLLVVILVAWTILIRLSFSCLDDYSHIEGFKNNNIKLEKLTRHIKENLHTYITNGFMIGAVGSR